MLSVDDLMDVAIDALTHRPGQPRPTLLADVHVSGERSTETDPFDLGNADIGVSQRIVIPGHSAYKILIVEEGL